jgi:hypothetical protein
VLHRDDLGARRQPGIDLADRVLRRRWLHPVSNTRRQLAHVGAHGDAFEQAHRKSSLEPRGSAGQFSANAGTSAQRAASLPLAESRKGVIEAGCGGDRLEETRKRRGMSLAESLAQRRNKHVYHCLDRCPAARVLAHRRRRLFLPPLVEALRTDRRDRFAEHAAAVPEILEHVVTRARGAEHDRIAGRA